MGLARLAANGLTATEKENACGQADVAILAVPDTVLGAVAHDIVPRLRPGALVIALDPAAPHSGELPERGDIAYFVVHPCHPPIVNDEVEPEARMDFWGGIAAKQHIVCALMQGAERDYTLGEQVARHMFAPVMNAYRVTVEQMAILEPAMSETVILTCMFVMKEAIDEAVRHGVPAEAAARVRAGTHERQRRHPVRLPQHRLLRRRQAGGGAGQGSTPAARLEAGVRARGCPGAGEGDYKGAGEGVRRCNGWPAAKRITSH